jgi:hypothetical protein
MAYPDYKPTHVNKNLYDQIVKEFEFVSFENLPIPIQTVPMTAYEYEYKTYFVFRSNLDLNLDY